MANPRTIAKLESRIHERVAHCLEFELADPRVGMITLTGVKLSPDLSLASAQSTTQAEVTVNARVGIDPENLQRCVLTAIDEVLIARLKRRELGLEITNEYIELTTR